MSATCPACSTVFAADACPTCALRARFEELNGKLRQRMTRLAARLDAIEERA